MYRTLGSSEASMLYTCERNEREAGGNGQKIRRSRRSSSSSVKPLGVDMNLTYAMLDSELSILYIIIGEFNFYFDFLCVITSTLLISDFSASKKSVVAA